MVFEWKFFFGIWLVRFRFRAHFNSWEDIFDNRSCLTGIKIDHLKPEVMFSNRKCLVNSLFLNNLKKRWLTFIVLRKFNIVSIWYRYRKYRFKPEIPFQTGNAQNTRDIRLILINFDFISWFPKNESKRLKPNFDIVNFWLDPWSSNHKWNPKVSPGFLTISTSWGV